MSADPRVTWLLEQETRALLTRLAAVRPFVLQETSVAAAALSPAATSGIEEYLLDRRRTVRARAVAYLRWLRGRGAEAPAAEQQRRFWSLRVDFQIALSQLDLFSEAITQRSEHDDGVLLSGLDVAAAEALRVPDHLIDPPPVVCSLHAGLGGTIRRVRTQLPGGGDNPVALIRIPRERMVGFGIASSLVHECGHQGAAFLGLVESLREQLRSVVRARADRPVWRLWERWISEIVADCWAIAKLGIGSTLGLIGLVSLPSAHVFRTPRGDPHPIPWVRVLLSCAIGDRLYPDRQWRRLASTWRSMYPVAHAGALVGRTVDELSATMPELVSILLGHRPPQLRGRSLGGLLGNPQVHREALLARYRRWLADPTQMSAEPPTLAFAVLGQARASGLLAPEQESELLRQLIRGWAVVSTLETARASGQATRATFGGQPVIWTDPYPRTRLAPAI